MSTVPPSGASPSSSRLLRALAQGDPLALASLQGSAVRLRPSRLVPRPWGGERLPAFTGLEAPEGAPAGEAFLVSAWSDDAEAADNPSIAVLPDGAELPLPELLAATGELLLGSRLHARFGPRWPLLPKLLDVGALLSVQAHPPGSPEIYVILATDPGATIAVGFRRDLEREPLRRELDEARRLQDDLARQLAPETEESALQPIIAPWMARPDQPARELLPSLRPLLRQGLDEPTLAAQLERLRAIHTSLLEALHPLPVAPGEVIYNRQLAVPPPGELPSADVHALGNVAGRSVLMLELRLPGGTLRAWDHARFPRRRMDLDAALEALPLRATPAGFYRVEPRPAPQRPGVLRSVHCELFALDHLRPGTQPSVPLPALPCASTLHALRGFAQLYDAHGQLLQELLPGDTLLIPAGLACSLRSQLIHSEILHVTMLPDAPSAGSPAPPAEEEPVRLRFGTSGLRGLVRHMTDREVYLATAGFVDFLETSGQLPPGAPLAIAEDLRARCSATGMESSPRIARAVAQACAHAGHPVIHCGQLPTPALAYWASLDLPEQGKAPMPAVMITGSHIPSDRNGVKFYKLAGEVLKSDEPAILAAVQRRRDRLDAQSAEDSLFDERGAFRGPAPELPATPAAREAYLRRYLDAFGGDRPLAGRRIVFFEHSAVGRDLFPELLASLGAEVVRLGRTDAFVAIDTEDLGQEALERFGAIVSEHRPFALVSTDGDSDRPLLIDERGHFHRGDLLGLVTALELGAGFAAVPVSSNDAIDLHLEALARDGRPVELAKTRIGSPWVIAAMERAVERGLEGVAGWEANGGFLLGSDLGVGDTTLRALPTRDAALPLLAVLVGAARRGLPVSALFDALPQRAATAALIDGVAPGTSRAILALLAPGGRPDPDAITEAFASVPGLGPLHRPDSTDGLRLHFASGEIVHLRPSGNAPQLRCYAVADSRERAQELLQRVLQADDGVVRSLMARLEGRSA